MAKMIWTKEGVVRTLAHLQITQHFRSRVRVFGGDEDPGRQVVVEQIIGNGLAEDFRAGGQEFAAFLEAHPAWSQQTLRDDAGTEAVGNESLFHLHLRAIGKAGDLLETDALLARPILHLLVGRMVVEEPLDVPVDERAEAHVRDFLMQGGEGAGLVAFRLGEHSFSDKP